jgi:uncharacterized protein YutE (UPF0331/DUF86 family)
MYLRYWRKAAGLKQLWPARLKRMVGFRNMAVHDYQSLQLPITIAILKTHLDEFLQYSHALLRREATRQV